MLKKSFMWLAAVATALVTSCVNDGLQEPQDPSSVNMLPTVEEQALAVKASVEGLHDLQAALEPHDVELEGVDAFEKDAETLYKGVTLEEATLASFRLQKQVADILGPAIAALDQETYEKEFKESFTAFGDGVKTWAGKDFPSLYPAALTASWINAASAELGSMLHRQKLYVEAVASDVDAGLKKDENPEELSSLSANVDENSKAVTAVASEASALVAETDRIYAETVSTMISDPSSFNAVALSEFNARTVAAVSETTVTLSELISRVEECEARLDDILERLGDLEDQISDLSGLLGLIQSVAFVSGFSGDEAASYYTLSTERLSGTDICKRIPAESIELQYLVRPAAAATALAQEDMWNNGLKVLYYYAEAMTKAAPVTFELNITDVAVTDEVLGLVTVTAGNGFKDDFFLKQTGAKLALSVVTGKTDLTSRFVEVVPVDQSGTVYVESLSLDKTYVEVDDGQTAQLTATVTPSSAYDKTLVWNSNNTDVVTVSTTGQLTAKSVGTATITATTNGTDEWGNPLTATCNVKVLSKIKLIGSSSVAVGGTIELRVESPDYLDPESVSWISSNTSKATVGATGTTVTVTAIANTYSQSDKTYSPIYITCDASGNILTHELYVVETQPQYLTWKTLGDVSSKTVKIGQELDMSASIYPTSVSSSYFKVIYQVLGAGDENIATVNYSTGKVTANGAGTLTFFARAFDADSQYSYFYPSGNLIRKFLEVTVEPIHLTKIDVTQTLELTPGSSAQLAVTLTSDTDGYPPTYPGLTYSSGDESIATVDQSGNVTGIKAGTAYITVSSTQYPDISATCTVDVTEEWLEFEVGYYVIRTSDGTIAFESAPYNDNSLAPNSYSSTQGTIVGIVIYKGNPRATDVKLPEKCIHGVAMGIEEASKAMLSSTNFSLGDYYSSHSSSGSDPTIQSACLGYNNTNMLKAAIVENGYTSEILTSLESYSRDSSKPLETSDWYLPSYYEAKLIQNRFGNKCYTSGDNYVFISSAAYAGGIGYGAKTDAQTKYWVVTGNVTAGAYSFAFTDTSMPSVTTPMTNTCKSLYLFAF